MRRGWPPRPLSRCAKFLSGGTPSKAVAEFWEGDIPWVSSGEMAQTRIHDTPLRITAEAARAGSRLVPANTVLAVVRGMSLANEFRVAITKREVAFNQDLRAFACESDVEPEFLFYSLFARRENIRELSTEASHGTKKLETHVLADVQIAVPGTDVQRRVVKLISAYDDLIENNRRRVALLEKAARLLYEEWFVHLRFPGHQGARNSGGIPEGWQRVPFSALANFVNGYAFKPEELGDGGLPIVKIPELWAGVSPKTPRNTGENIPEKYLLQNGDLLFSWSGTLLVEFWYDGPAILNQHLFRVETSDPLARVFMLHALRQALPDFSNQTTGATLKHIRKSALTTVRTKLPPRTLLTQFDEFASMIYRQILSLRRQNSNLIKARDLLLPRLMSGEITV